MSVTLSINAVLVGYVVIEFTRWYEQLASCGAPERESREVGKSGHPDVGAASGGLFSVYVSEMFVSAIIPYVVN